MITLPPLVLKVFVFGNYYKLQIHTQSNFEKSRDDETSYTAPFKNKKIMISNQEIEKEKACGIWNAKSRRDEIINIYIKNHYRCTHIYIDRDQFCFRRYRHQIFIHRVKNGKYKWRRRQ